MAQVLGRLSGRALRSHIGLSKTTVDDKVSGVDEATLVARQEDDCVGLLNRFTETARGEVNLATETLLLIITQPVLQKWCAKYCQLGVSHNKQGRTYLRGAGHKELNRKPSRACTIANSLVMANTAPLLAVYAN